MTGDRRLEEVARVFRETPLNGIWEGVGNVVCLDVLGPSHPARATRPRPGTTGRP